MKVAEAMAEILDTEVKKPAEINIEELTKYALIGFGSGIYNRKHHRSLFDLINKVEFQNSMKAFVFST